MFIDCGSITFGYRVYNRPSHDNVTYESWGKSLAADHRECVGNSKHVLRSSISSLRGKTDCLHMLIFATQGVGVLMSEFDCCIAMW